MHASTKQSNAAKRQSSHFEWLQAGQNNTNENGYGKGSLCRNTKVQATLYRNCGQKLKVYIHSDLQQGNPKLPRKPYMQMRASTRQSNAANLNGCKLDKTVQINADAPKAQCHNTKDCTEHSTNLGAPFLKS